MTAGRTEGAAPLGDSGLLSAIVEGTPDAVFVKDLDGRYLLVNSACARILRRPKEEIVGRDDTQILPPDTAARLAEVDWLVMNTGEASSYEEVLPVAGRPRTYLSTKSVYRDAAGNAAGIIGISRDITERKMAEQELMRREEQFRSLAEGVDFVPWEADLATWRYTYVGPQAAEILGYPPEDWYRDGFWVDRIHPEDREWVTEYCARKSDSGLRYRFEYRMLASDGRVVWLDDIVSVVEGWDGTKRLQGVMVDITERKRAEEAVREVREAERARMARDLHDGVMQDLSYTAASMGVMMLDARGTEQEGRLQGTIDAVRRAAQGIREAVNDLRIEEELGRPFPELVGSLVEEARAMDPGCEYHLEVREGVPRGPLGEAGVELSRLIREALTNARRHSGARSVDVALLNEGDELVAEVSDDGRGLGQGAEPGMGTRSMRARARRLGGELAVESAPGAGTLVRARVPMRAALRGGRPGESGPVGPGQ
jgi:PAS domain S-box-containing protein